ncbi:MAG: HAMP domain-containing histidine kinase, partial [Pseudomonadota bacterium]|nr:HAMP domain-containing histidine kinase [Pseudomonadota bacterium]
VLDAIQGTIGHGTRVINQLLTLAALEQERHSQQIEAATQVDLAETATAVLERLAPLAQLRQIELGVDGLDPQLYVAAPRALLEEVISNLVDNAIQHIPIGGAVTVSCRLESEYVLLRVTDTGPGIAPEQRDKVFQRFYQIDSKPNSSGLGLAIVREICEALGATVALSTPPNGIGLQVEVRFAMLEPPRR